MSLFDKSAATYDEWCSTPLGSFVDALEKRLMADVARPKHGETALDLGCGTGIYSLWLAKQKLSVTGIDISTEMLKKASEKALKQQMNIDFIQGDIHHLPFQDEQFDLVISNLVLEFVEDPGRAISESLRILKKGGRLVVGMIGKQSEWADNYVKRGLENPGSVFANARFFSLKEIAQLNYLQPSEIRLGLYFSPSEFRNEEQAEELEKVRASTQQEKGAGFIVVRWDKK